MPALAAQARTHTRKFLLRCLTPLMSNPLQARLVALMAKTGIGTERALREGGLPLPVHYYSPVPDINDLRRRGVWSRRSDLAGIDLRLDDQLRLLQELGHRFGSECAWAAHASGDESVFHTENNSFSFGCAASTHCVIRDRKPRRVVEIGSGRSSQVIAAALALNEHDGAPTALYDVIDPYPSPLLDVIPGCRPNVVAGRVELVEPGVFDALGSGDVLFIDSGHVVRTGGDVNCLILDVLPRLHSGCVVHFHDISLPFEYPEVYATNPQFRMFWTEAYLLQAFLAFNSGYDVLLAMSLLMNDHPDEFQAAFPSYRPAEHASGSGSFWIVRT